jgi:hypothetical protein
MQIEKLSKELKAIRKLKSDEYGPFNKKMQDIADIWSVLIGKKLRPHQVALMYAMAKIIRANNEYKYDSYIDAINYLVQADEIHREDVSELVDSYFPTTNRMSLYEFKLDMEFSGYDFFIELNIKNFIRFI